MGCSESNLGEIKSPERFDAFRDSSQSNVTHYEKKENDQSTNQNSFLSQDEIASEYEKADGNFDIFFNNISEKISQLYVNVSSTALEELNAHRMDTTQSKVFISEKILVMSLNVLQVLGKKTTHSYPISVFKKFNKTQSSLIAYLKMKYPRGGPTFVPGDITKVFQTFNMVESPDNDILRNANICFYEQSEKNIVYKLKEMFNKIIDELDSKFPKFQTLLQEKVFSVQIQGKSKFLNYKIGRKLPETIGKYNLNEEEEFSISSPEIFRVIIKWIGDMEEFLLTPDEEVNEKQTFKTYIEEDGKIQFDEISPDDIEGLKTTLKDKLSSVKGEYQEQMTKLRKDMDLFNMNLLRILETAERKEKFVPKTEANVIKYSMLNTKVVSWLLIRKLIFVLKNLIRIGKSLKQNTNEIINLDLIKFNVTDLMRAMISGNKKEIIAVYDNMKFLEKEKIIKIIKIKNRLGTPLNDAMIIFMISDSFLICELQLILTEGQGTSQKLKNIEFLNHFLYELERSPYGVLSELSVVLGYKDTKVNYENKINFINTLSLKIEECEKNHEQSVLFLEEQTKPFFCSKCTIYYDPLQSVLGMKSCEVCNLSICCKCLFENNKEGQAEKIHKKFLHVIQNHVFLEKYRNSYPKQFGVQNILKLMKEKKYYLSQEISKSFHKIKPKDVEKFLYSIDSENRIHETYADGFFFVLVQFKGSSTYLKSYFWNSNLEEVEDALDSGQNFYKLKNVSTSFYDFIMVFDKEKLKLKEIEVSKAEQAIKLTLKNKELNLKKIKKFVFHSMTEKKDQKKIYLIFKISSDKKSSFEGLEIDSNVLLNKKQFAYESIEEARVSIPELTILKENFRMQNVGITSHHLKYFSTCKWREDIKNLDLNDNQIVDISLIFESLPNLENLYISKNFIQAIKIKNQLKNLKKFICFDNMVEHLEGFNNLPVLKKLNLSKNRLKKFETLNLKHLKQLLLSNNKLEKTTEIEKSNLPSLQNFIFVEGNENSLQKVELGFQKLKKININQAKIDELSIKSHHLEFLSCNNCNLKILNFIGRKLKHLSLNYNILNNYEEIISQDFLQLEHLSIQYNSQFLDNVPIINSEKMKNAIFQGSYIRSSSNIEKWNTPLLESINFGYNIQQEQSVFPAMNFPNLKQISTVYEVYKDISNLQKSNLSKLKEFSVTGTRDASIPFPKLSFPSLQNLSLIQYNFVNCQNLTDSDLKVLKSLTLNSLTMEELPEMNFPELETIYIYNMTTKKTINFEKSSLPKISSLTLSYVEAIEGFENQVKIKNIPFPSLKTLSCDNVSEIQFFNENLPQKLSSITFQASKIKKFPLLQNSNLQSLYFSTIQFGSLENLPSCTWKCLNSFQVQNSSLKKVPMINCKTLTSLSLYSNQIENCQQLIELKLPNIQNLNMQSNILKEFPVLKYSKLKTLSLDYNQIQRIDSIAICHLQNLQSFSLTSIENLAKPELPAFNFPSLKSLTVSTSNLNNIDNLSFSKLPKITHLNFSYCQIQKLPVLNFATLQYFQCSYSYDYEKSLVDIEALAFWICPQIIEISVVYNKIQKLPRLNLPKLSSFGFDGNPLKEVSEFKESKLPELKTMQTYSQNPELKTLIYVKNASFTNYSLSNTSIEDVSELINFKAEYLYLNGGQIKTIPFEALDNFQSANFCYHQIHTISQPLMMEETFYIKQLYLTGNKIQNWKDFPLYSLETLELSNNLLTSFNTSEENLAKIKTLNLSTNKIQKAFFPFPNLQYLYMDSNPLKKIDCFNKKITYKNFYYLSFSSCSIKQINYLPGAANWYLGENQIENFDWINKCNTSNLSELTLNNNKIRSIDGMKQIPISKFQSINLSYNQIDEFPENISFPKTSYLYMNNNKIKTLSITQKNFPLVSYVNFSDNQLTSIKISTKNIQTLQLGNNKLSTLDLLSLNKLTSLNLCKNELTETDWLSKSSIPNISYIYLEENKITSAPALKKWKNFYNLSIGQNPLVNFDNWLKIGKKNENLSLNYSMDKSKLSKQEQKKIQEKLLELYPSSYCEDISGQQNQGENENNENQGQNEYNENLWNLDMGNVEGEGHEEVIE